MNIAVVTTSLGLGGITSFCFGLVNYLAGKEGVHVTFFYTKDEHGLIKDFDKRVSFVKYEAPKSNTVTFMVRALCRGGLWKLIRLKKRVHTDISPTDSIQFVNRLLADMTNELPGTYDMAVSTAEFYCNDIVANKTQAKYKVGWIHPDYSKLGVNVEYELLTLRKLDRIVGVSDASTQSLIELFPSIKDRFMTIYNMLLPEFVEKRAEGDIKNSKSFDTTDIKILTVCRIDNSSKRLDRIIRACVYFKEQGLAFHWFVIGDGEDLNTLKVMASDQKVDDSISFLGSMNNPYPYYKLADVFVLTSQYEGKPVVVDEALAMKCPVVVTNYKSAKEQVPKVYGRVIENDDNAVSEQLYSVLSNKEQIEQWHKNLDSYLPDNKKAIENIDNLISLANE